MGRKKGLIHTQPKELLGEVKSGTMTGAEISPNWIIVLRTSCDCDGLFWLLPMTGPELEEWWVNQETFRFGDPESDAMLARIFNEPPPPPGRTEPIPGESIEALAIDDQWDNVELWNAMWGSNKFYTCLLCCNSRSYLRTPDRRYIYHKGYAGDRGEEQYQVERYEKNSDIDAEQKPDVSWVPETLTSSEIKRLKRDKKKGVARTLKALAKLRK